MVAEEEGVGVKTPPNTQPQTQDGRPQGMLTHLLLVHVSAIGNLENQVLYVLNQLHAHGNNTSHQELKIEGLTSP